MKGIILDVGSDFITLLTPDGQYLKAQKQQKEYFIGEEVSFIPASSPDTKKKNKGISAFFRRNSVLLTSAAAFLLMLSLLPMLFSDKASAYMTIDINPSLELGLNDELQVIDIEGLNKEGKIILKKITNWKKESVGLVTNKIIEESKRTGYLAKQEEIVVSTVIMKDEKREMDSKLDNALNSSQIKQHNPDAKFTVVKASLSDREKAIEKGISTGKYVKSQEQKEKKTKRLIKPVDSVKESKQLHDKTKKKSEPATKQKSKKPASNSTVPSPEAKVEEGKNNRAVSQQQPNKNKAQNKVNQNSSKTNHEDHSNNQRYKKDNKTDIKREKKLEPAEKKRVKSRPANHNNGKKNQTQASKQDTEPHIQTVSKKYKEHKHSKGN
ncbi:hypothetical protein JOC77_002541 [Peribacillus deserti]|uniref:RsgI N-terminal anti-sigma domain-containing protein n=1 Tax=Peribacillus deserti TaxID=673318 RepID=A0ABS2QJ29_9BACI|nr:anti-sigma factor domain-containing protein [Peribacillus deserti]MBM7693102.1 hypothetical protein [Peribacillus deserti]